MRLRAASTGAAIAVLVASLAGSACDDEKEHRAAPAVSPPPAPPPPLPPPRPGCARIGPVSGPGSVESDPSCVVPKASEDAMREAMKRIATTVELEPAEISGGGTASVVVTLRNTTADEVDVLFEGKSHAPGPRPDWSRVAGIPEQHEPPPDQADKPRIFFPMTTTDGNRREVDAVPTVAGSTPAPGPTTIYLVHLRPGGKLVHKAPWWALRIPAPAPIVKDDAGHRYVPKTTALPLPPGDYGVQIEIPLYGLTREERKFSAAAHVLRAPLPDGGGGPR